MISPRGILLFLILSWPWALVEAKKAPKPAKVTVATDCKVMTDSMAKLYEAGDPTYLTWNIPAKCDSSQLYSLNYYQGIGFYLLGDWREASYFLNQAKEIRGPKDEEILYHLWNVNKKLQRYQDMERATLELHQRYPNSFFLMEILDQWKTVKPPSQAWSFGYTSKYASYTTEYASGPKSTYLENIFTNSLRASTGQTYGQHRFQETGTVTMKAKMDEKTLQGLQGDIGGEYDYKGFSAQVDYGGGYQSHSTSDPLLLLSNGLETRLVDSNWNFRQGRLTLGYSTDSKNGWSQGWNLNLLELSKDWSMASVSHIESIFLLSGILLLNLEAQKHWVKAVYSDSSVLTTPTSTPTMTWDGMNAFTAGVMPLYYWKKQSLLFGATYYFSQSHFSAGNGTNDQEYEQSLTGSASYSYDFFSWLRINFDASYGFDYSQSFQTGYPSKPDRVYGMDAGFSLSF